MLRASSWVLFVTKRGRGSRLRRGSATLHQQYARNIRRYSGYDLDSEDFLIRTQHPSHLSKAWLREEWKDADEGGNLLEDLNVTLQERVKQILKALVRACWR